jgi:photosystem II stability/assembly factor-like uncharacterized protein
MYAATEDGIYRMDMRHPDSGWVAMGLQGTHAGDVLAIDETIIYAGAEIGTYALYRTVDGGAEWTPLPWGAGAGGFVPVYCLTQLSDSYTSLAGGGPAVIALSYDGGLIWMPTWGSWMTLGKGIHFVRATTQQPQIMWAGGESAFFYAVLLKSTDGGATWFSQNAPEGGDNRCHDVAARPDDPDIAYVGMEGVIGRTVDGGDKWSPLLFTDQYHYTVAIDPIRQLIVYVSGAHHTDPMTIWKSIDGGESWSSIEEPTHPNNLFFDFILATESDSNVLYCASEYGVFKYIDFDIIEDSNFACGDFVDYGVIDSADVALLFDYVAREGRPPFPLEIGNVDGCEAVDIADVAYLSRYVYAGGAEPCSSDITCEVQAGSSFVRIDCPIEVTDPSGDSIFMQIWVRCDSLLSGLTLGFTVSSEDVEIGSVDLEGSILTASQRDHCAYLMEDERMAFLLSWVDFSSSDPLDVSNEGLLCRVWVRIPAGIPDQEIDIDSAFVSPAGIFRFSIASGGYVRPDYIDCGTSDIVISSSSYICGDADASGEVDIDDVVHLIEYIFSGGPEPVPYESGDADCSSGVDIDDVVWLIAYIFSSGNEPCDSDGNGVPDC